MGTVGRVERGSHRHAVTSMAASVGPYMLYSSASGITVAKRRGSATHSVAETGDAQIAVARAEGVLQAAKAFVIDALGALWDTACAGDPPTVESRARVQLAALNAQRSAEIAIDAVMPFAGAAGVYSSQPLQRCFRNIHTAGQHIFFGSDAWKRFARLRLGIDQPTFMI